MGPAASASFSIKFVKTLNAELPEQYGAGIVVEHPTYNFEDWPLNRPVITKRPQLPPYNTTMRFFDSQHAYIGTIFAFVDPHQFHTRVSKIYQDYEDPAFHPDFSRRNTCLEYCSLFLVIAFGKIYKINEWTSHEGPPGFSDFIQALQFLPEVREEPSVLFVEVLSLVGYFYQNLNRRDTAFLYVSFNLHQRALSDDFRLAWL
jgi:proline utilization trans-activator